MRGRYPGAAERSQTAHILPLIDSQYRMRHDLGMLTIGQAFFAVLIGFACTFLSVDCSRKAAIARGDISAQMPYFATCRSWTAECAKARPLAECRMDAVALGCKAQPQAPTASTSPFARWASACVAGQGCRVVPRAAAVTQPDPFDDIPAADDFDAPAPP